MVSERDPLANDQNALKSAKRRRAGYGFGAWVSPKTRGYGLAGVLTGKLASCLFNEAGGDCSIAFVRSHNVAALRAAEKDGNSTLAQVRAFGLSCPNTGAAIEILGASSLSIIELAPDETVQLWQRVYGDADTSRSSNLLLCNTNEVAFNAQHQTTFVHSYEETFDAPEWLERSAVRHHVVGLSVWIPEAASMCSTLASHPIQAGTRHGVIYNVFYSAPPAPDPPLPQAALDRLLHELLDHALSWLAALHEVEAALVLLPNALPAHLHFGGIRATPPSADNLQRLEQNTRHISNLVASRAFAVNRFTVLGVNLYQGYVPERVFLDPRDFVPWVVFDESSQLVDDIDIESPPKPKASL